MTSSTALVFLDVMFPLPHDFVRYDPNRCVLELNEPWPIEDED